MTDQPSEKDALNAGTDAALYVVCVVLAVVVLVLDGNVPLGVAVVILYNAVVLLALRTRDRKFIVLLTVVVSIFTVGPLFHKAPIEEMWKAVSNRLLALFSIWVVCYLGLRWETLQEKQEKALREREKALEEVRVLRGFLPICASCKKIRDLEGSWTLLERYISEHSEAEFSHGLCPDCSKKLFPNLFKEPERGDVERH